MDTLPENVQVWTVWSYVTILRFIWHYRYLSCKIFIATDWWDWSAQNPIRPIQSIYAFHLGNSRTHLRLDSESRCKFKFVRAAIRAQVVEATAPLSRNTFPFDRIDGIRFPQILWDLYCCGHETHRVLIPEAQEQLGRVLKIGWQSHPVNCLKAIGEEWTSSKNSKQEICGCPFDFASSTPYLLRIHRI